VHRSRFFLIGDEVAFSVFGQKGVYLGQDFCVFAVGVELLAGLGRARSGVGVAELTIMFSSFAIFSFCLSFYLQSID
jgi:hypothetical protein